VRVWFWLTTALGGARHRVSRGVSAEVGRAKQAGKDRWAKALCLKLDRFVQGNRDALAVVRVPGEEEERARALHRQREQLVQVRKQLEAQGRSLLVAPLPSKLPLCDTLGLSPRYATSFLL